MASNKHADLRKTENLVLEVKVILKIYQKIKERKLILENLVRTFKIVGGHLTYKGKKKGDI